MFVYNIKDESFAVKRNTGWRDKRRDILRFVERRNGMTGGDRKGDIGVGKMVTVGPRKMVLIK